jgi:hypothetical protein
MKRVVLIVALSLLAATIVASLTNSETPQAPKQAMDLGLSAGAVILDLDDQALDEDLERMVFVGMTELRLDFDWSRIEKSAGDYDWSTVDRILSAAESHDIAVHALVTYTPRWARPPDTSDKHPPSNPGDFAAFVAAAVERYSQRGVESWEIWNEPNVSWFWSAPSGPDPLAFAELVTAASRAIREIDPTAEVISGGLAPAVDDPGDEVAPETFLEGFLAAIEPGTIDAVGIHPYSYPAAPDDRSKSWNLFGRLPEIHELVSEWAGADVPLWITEYGAPTGEASRALSETTQAMLIEAALGCANQTEWIEELFLYNLRDRDGGDADDIEDNFGLFYSDGTPKESATVVEQFQGRAPGQPVSSPCDDW